MAGKQKTLHFVKMQGAGNDCIIIDLMKSKPLNPQRLARKICNRRLGVGADQLLLLAKSRKADFKMQIFNADGSEAEMCGNGIRCLARYIREAGYTSKKEMTIETLAGIRKVKVASKAVEVNLGEPKLKGKEIPVHLSGRIINRPLKIDAKDFRITCLSLGNPHCVIYQENLDTFPVEKYGPLLEHYHLFPHRTNISFVNVLSTGELKARVWERGVGETLACGTAAAASLVASVLNGFTERKVKIELPGGKLEVEWNRDDNTVWLSGPAEKVCEGEFPLY
ncbi:MAG: diaminopimelate epimerase [Deltaproteobacteria bacterium]|nr:diaminopimelate epimerase [Deltaproteobacteria bacterium]MDZ4224915.1 diaminopimelate epimerase [bacterium]